VNRSGSKLPYNFDAVRIGARLLGMLRQQGVAVDEEEWEEGY